MEISSEKYSRRKNVKYLLQEPRPGLARNLILIFVQPSRPAKSSHLASSRNGSRAHSCASNAALRQASPQEGGPLHRPSIGRKDAAWHSIKSLGAQTMGESAYVWLGQRGLRPWLNPRLERRSCGSLVSGACSSPPKPRCHTVVFVSVAALTKDRLVEVLRMASRFNATVMCLQESRRPEFPFLFFNKRQMTIAEHFCWVEGLYKR